MNVHCWRACKDKRKLCENAPSVDAHKASQERKKFFIIPEKEAHELFLFFEQEELWFLVRFVGI